MSHSNQSPTPYRKNSTRNYLGSIALASVFLFTISAVAPASATPIENPEILFKSSIIGAKKADKQNLTVQTNVASAVVQRDAITATSETELAQITLAAHQAEIIQRQVTGGGNSAAPSGLIPDQVIPADGIIAAAQQWVSIVPYGHGNNPNDSFSCDGYVQYVYAQNGISLPRGADAQAHLGSPINRGDAKAGDLLWWPGQHIGIYDGNGGMYDSPMPGRNVQHRVGSLWGDPVFIRM